MGKPNGVFRLFIFICLIVLPLAVQADEWINQRLNQDSTTELQNEEQIAINPANPNNMVAVWRDFRLGYRRLGWSYTFDAGASWTEGGLLEESHYPWHSDPGITTDLDGNFYVIILSYTSTSEPNGFFVQKSTDGGVTWGPSMTVIDQYPGVFEDKEFIACDRTDSAHAGNLYVTWARFSSITEIMYRRSTDSGQTWGNSIRVGDISNVQFPIPVVGRSGEVYIAWTSYYSSAILLDVSTDGGATFGADRTVVNVYTPSTELNGGVDAYSSPHMDADITDGPYSGRLYLSFMDRRGGFTDRDIWVMFSDDMGSNWSTPVRINDDTPGNGRDQFLPWLTVDNQGTVTVVFLDRRNDPQNRKYHCYLTQSTDGGLTWAANTQVSTEASDPNFAFTGNLPNDTAIDLGQPVISLSRAGLLGEYIGVVSHNGRAVPIWTDIRNLHQDAYAGFNSTGAGVESLEPSGGRGGLRLSRNPVHAGQRVFIQAPLGDMPAGRTPALLDIHGLDGRHIRTLTGDFSGAEAVYLWDGRMENGDLVNSGLYFLNLDSRSRVGGRIVIVK